MRPGRQRSSAIQMGLSTGRNVLRLEPLCPRLLDGQQLDWRRTFRDSVLSTCDRNYLTRRRDGLGWINERLTTW